MRTRETILRRKPDLGGAVLACFRQACSEGRLSVAEHLLVAIEELSKEDSGGSEREHHLAEAYGVLVDVMTPRQSADGSTHIPCR